MKRYCTLLLIFFTLISCGKDNKVDLVDLNPPQKPDGDISISLIGNWKLTQITCFDPMNKDIITSKAELHVDSSEANLVFEKYLYTYTQEKGCTASVKALHNAVIKDGTKDKGYGKIYLDHAYVNSSTPTCTLTEKYNNGTPLLITPDEETSVFEDGSNQNLKEYNIKLDKKNHIVSTLYIESEHKAQHRPTDKCYKTYELQP